MAEASFSSWAVEAAQERALLGLYVRGHPLRDITRRAQSDPRLRAITAIQLPDCQPEQRITMIGVAAEVRVIQTKRRQDMAFITMEDATGQYGATAFPMILTMFASVFVVGHLVIIEGRASHRPDGRRKKEGEDGVEEAGSGVRVELVVENAWNYGDRHEQGG